MEPDETGTSETPDETVAEPTPAAAPSEDVHVAHRDLAEWRGMDLIDRDGERIGALQDVYFDIETDEPQFGTVKEGFFHKHLAFVPLAGVTIGPSSLQVTASKEEIKSAPSIGSEGDELSADEESTLYHHYRLNYTPSDNPSGRRLARR